MIGTNNTACLIRNAEISHNLFAMRGGGFYIDTNAACTIENCNTGDGIHGNKAVEWGGGVYANSSSPVITDSLLRLLAGCLKTRRTSPIYAASAAP